MTQSSHALSCCRQRKLIHIYDTKCMQMGCKFTYEGFMMLDKYSVLCENCILVLYERQNDEHECQCRRSAVKIAVEHNSCFVCLKNGASQGGCAKRVSAASDWLRRFQLNLQTRERRVISSICFINHMVHSSFYIIYFILVFKLNYDMMPEHYCSMR